MVLLVCLAFVGQAMASTMMSYHMMGMAGMIGQEQPENMMMMMDHSNHQMMTDDSEASDSASEECCSKTCNCFAGGCSTAAAFMKNSANSPIIALTTKIVTSNQLVLRQQPTSLYRPPISS